MYLNILELDDIYKDIRKNVPSARIADEICFSTRKRQEAIKQLGNDIDCIVVIGDKKSSNSTRLLEIAKMSHPQIASYMVSNVDELDLGLLCNKKHIVLASGASVAIETIDAIYNKINSLN